MKRSLRLKANNNGSPVYGQTVGWVNSPERLLPPGFSLTRANTGTHFDSAGLLQTAAIDAPRGTYRYNGSAWVFDGTIVESAATNLWLQSEVVASWTGFVLSNATQTANQYTAPTGAATVDQITASVGNSQHFVAGASAALTAGVNTFSVYFRYDNHQWVQIHCNDGTNVPAAAFDLQNGVVGAVTGGYTSSITNVGGGIYRCSISGTFLAVGTSMYLCFLGSNTASPAPVYNAAGTEKFGVWGVQVEFGLAPTSYIPTNTATVTRSADVVTAPTSGLLANAQGFAAISGRNITYNPATSGPTYMASAAFGSGFVLRQTPSLLALEDGTSQPTLTTGFTPGQLFSVAGTWGAAGMTVASSGNLSSTVSFDGSMNHGATLYLGSLPSGLDTKSFVLQSLRLGTRGVTSSELAGWTV